MAVVIGSIAVVSLRYLMSTIMVKRITRVYQNRSQPSPTLLLITYYQ